MSTAFTSKYFFNKLNAYVGSKNVFKHSDLRTVCKLNANGILSLAI